MQTVVSFHAHPDDEALLTGGYLAARAARGDRVVLVVATDGAAGLADPTIGCLADTRARELEEAARHLGIARIVRLGYADSGMAGSPTAGPGRFVDARPQDVARRLANILDDEAADVLTGYDGRGGYGHPDHVQVHRVARLAQDLASRRPQLLEATRDRRTLVRAIRLVRPVEWALPGITLPGTAIFSAPHEITHRIDVRAHLLAKRAALAAHSSQATGGVRTIGVLLRLPRWLERRVLGIECFTEVR
jgi:LmbE family N-acetylglucosaminyl deacetylase